MAVNRLASENFKRCLGGNWYPHHGIVSNAEIHYLRNNKNCRTRTGCMMPWVVFRLACISLSLSLPVFSFLFFPWVELEYLSVKSRWWLITAKGSGWGGICNLAENPHQNVIWRWLRTPFPQPIMLRSFHHAELFFIYFIFSCPGINIDKFPFGAAFPGRCTCPPCSL